MCYWPWLKTPSSSIACHMPAACVRVWTITDRFISQSTSSVPKAHFRINLPETYENKNKKKRRKEKDKRKVGVWEREKNETHQTIMLLFLYRHIHSSLMVITLDTTKLGFYVLLFVLRSFWTMLIYASVITTLISSLFSLFVISIWSFSLFFSLWLLVQRIL